MSQGVLLGLRSSLELTDACVIDGDKETVTFAIKIPRAVIGANHHFLLAASEAATDIRQSPVIRSRSIQTASHWATRFARQLPTILGLAASAAFLAMAGMWSYYTIVPVVDYKTIVPDRPIISSGEPLVLIVTAQHNRACQAIFSRTVVNEATNEAVWSDRYPGRHSSASNGYETFTSVVPLTKLPPGYYALQILGDFDCGSLDDHARQIANVHFTVVE
jgi:hypothetical protein